MTEEDKPKKRPLDRTRRALARVGDVTERFGDWMAGKVKKHRYSLILGCGVTGAIAAHNTLPEMYTPISPLGFRQNDSVYRLSGFTPQTLLKENSVEPFLATQNYDTVIVALGPGIDPEGADVERLEKDLKSRGVRKVVILGDNKDQPFDRNDIIKAIEEPGKKGPTLCIVSAHGGRYKSKTDGIGRHVTTHKIISPKEWHAIDTGDLIASCHKANLSPYPMDFMVSSCDSYLHGAPADPSDKHVHGAVFHEGGAGGAVNQDSMLFMNTLCKSPFGFNRLGILFDFLATDSLTHKELPVITLDSATNAKWDLGKILKEALGKPLTEAQRKTAVELKAYLGGGIREYYTPWLIGGGRVPFDKFFDDTVREIEKGNVHKKHRGMAALIALMVYHLEEFKAVTQLDTEVTRAQQTIMENPSELPHPKDLPRALAPDFLRHVMSFRERIEEAQKHKPPQPPAHKR